MNRVIDPQGENQGNGKQAKSRRGQSGKEEAAGPLTGRQAEKQRWTVRHGVENNLCAWGLNPGDSRYVRLA